MKYVLTILGLKGGWISLCSILSQCIRRKNRLLLISSSPFAPRPEIFNFYKQRSHFEIVVSLLKCGFSLRGSGNSSYLIS